MDSFDFIRVDEKNVDCVFQVYKECEDFLSLGPDSKASLEMVYKDIEHSKESNGVYSLIKIESGHIIGIIDYIPQKYGEDGDYCYISLIMIKSKYRNKGYGKRVIKAIEELVHKHFGINKFWASVQTNNEKGINFWKAQGYVICSEPELQPDTTYCCPYEKGTEVI